MDYIEQSNKEQPFKGLTLNEKKYLWVYMCYIHHPNFTPEEIKKRWGDVLSIDELPTVFNALEIVNKIKEELKASVSTIQDIVVDDSKKLKNDSSYSLMFSIGAIFLSIIGLCCWMANKEADEQKCREIEASQQLKKIDEEFGVDTVLAYNHLNGIEKYSNDARCRKHLCEVFGIGVKRKSWLHISDCPIYGNCLEKAATSKEFCKGFSSLGWVDGSGLKLLREESKKIEQLKDYDISLLQRVAKLGDADAIKELADCYREGIKIDRDNSAAVFWYSKYILAVSDLKELHKLRELFSEDGEFTNENLWIQVLERLVSFGDVNSFALLGEKLLISDPHKASEYLYQALCKNVALSVDSMRICADLLDQSNQKEKAIKFYEKIANQGDYDAILWLGIYWYEQIPFHDNDARFGSLKHLSRRWDRLPGYWGSSKAKYWLELAVSKGSNEDVFLKLSLLYLSQGEYDRMLDCLRGALKFGNVDAAFELGVVYERGLYGVVANKAEAKRLYLIAANKGHQDAQLYYAYLLDSPQEAWDWVCKAAMQGNVEAQYQFGRLHDFYGWGAWGEGKWTSLRCSCDSHYGLQQTIIPKEASERYQKAAISWYRSAVKKGYKPAEYELSKHNVTLE